MCHHSIQYHLCNLNRELPTFHLIPKQTKFCSHAFFSCLDTSVCESADNPPTLPTLRHFPVNGRFIDIAEEIGPNYEKFGTLLLEDKNGNIVTMVTMSEHDDPLPITVRILKQWLRGKGRLPVTWQTLVTCLRDIHLNVLADKMDHSLSEHNSDHPYPQELQ